MNISSSVAVVAGAGVPVPDVEPAPEALLDPPWQRQRAGQPEPAGELRRRQPPRQLEQRQRITPGLGHDLVPDPRVQRPGQHRVKQRPRVALPQALHHELWQPGQLLVTRNPGREYQADRIRRQPPRHKAERLRRGAIEPLLVIHHAHQRPLPGHLR